MIRDTDCSRHHWRHCPWRGDVVEWFTRHPLASHCSCIECRAITGRLDELVEPDDPRDDLDPRGELW
jgi:hypothetical protein